MTDFLYSDTFRHPLTIPCWHFILVPSSESFFLRLAPSLSRSVTQISGCLFRDSKHCEVNAFVSYLYVWILWFIRSELLLHMDGHFCRALLLYCDCISWNCLKVLFIPMLASCHCACSFTSALQRRTCLKCRSYVTRRNY